MLAGSNPAARTSQSQSSRSPYRGAGRLFCTRFAGSIASHRHSMICGSLLPISFRLFNHDMRLSFPYLPASRIVFPRRRIGYLYSIRRVAPPIRLGRTRYHRLPPSVPFPIDGEDRSRFSLRFPIRPIGFSPSSSLRFPPDGSVPPLLSVFLYGRRGGCVFFARMSVFPVDFVAACDTLSIYMRAWWNGRHARFRFWWRNPCGFESHRPHHGNAQPASVARSGSCGGGLFPCRRN